MTDEQRGPSTPVAAEAGSSTPPPSLPVCEMATVIEYGYPNADYEGDRGLGQWEIAFCCDGLGKRDCGYRKPYDPGDMTGVLEPDDIAQAEAEHRAHSAENGALEKPSADFKAAQKAEHLPLENESTNLKSDAQEGT